MRLHSGQAEYWKSPRPTITKSQSKPLPAVSKRANFLPELGKLETNQAAALAGLALMTKQSGKWRDQAFIASGHANIRRSLQLRDSGSCGQSPEAT
ncbi:transposase [Brucella abortus]|uniref:transposase n=1 Tax=Brucella abortus TaxID=235 RepID=UPI0034501AB9